MLFGGVKNGRQKFPVGRANDASTSLLLAVVAVLLPTVYVISSPKSSNVSTGIGIDEISIGMSVLLLLVYVASLVQTVAESNTTGAVKAAEIRHNPTAEEPHSSVAMPAIALAVSSLLVAFLSDFVSDSVGAVKSQFGLSDLFLGVIVIAAIGNVAAQISAVSMAMKNKMDLSFEIGMSAATQIALLVIPFLVLMSFAFGKPVNLEFTIAEIVAVAAAAVVTTQIAQDGESNWLNGLQMLVVYAMVGILFFFLPF
jgi:Ca2+:H+ antiporter